MTTLRLITLPVHGAIEFALGLLAMVAPFALGLGPAASVSSVVLGAAVVGLALTTTDNALGVGTHYAFDYAVAVGAMGGALVLALAGQGPGSTFLAAFGLIQLALNLSTRYSARS